MLEKLKLDLADNFQSGDDAIITEEINHYEAIASNYTNRKVDDDILQPYIYDAVKKTYLRRGDEGSKSSNESGFSVSYEDIEEKLRKDILHLRLNKF